MAVEIRLRRDTTANWTAANPILDIGEPAVDLNTGFLRIGDGVTPYLSLPNQQALYATAAQLAAAQAAASASQAASPSSAAQVSSRRNRPRVLANSFRSFRLLKKGAVLPMGGTYRSVDVGLGLDVVLDPTTGRYAMLMAGYDGTSMSIGLMYSDDLINWADAVAGGQVFAKNSTAGQVDSGGVSFPQLVWDGTQWHMFYIGFSGTGFEGGFPSICRATSTALAGPWARQGQVLGPTAPWMSGTTDTVWRPNVTKDGNTYYCYFNGGTGGQEKIGYATASNLAGPWTYNSVASITPAQIGVNGLSDPDVFKVDESYYMLFWSEVGIHLATAPAIVGPWTTLGVVIPAGAAHYSRPVTVFTDRGLYLFATNGGAGVQPTEVEVFAPASITPPGAFAKVFRNNNNINLSNTTWAQYETALVITAAPGDLVRADVSMLWDNGSPNAFVDFASIVASNPVTAWSSDLAPDNGNQGIVGATGSGGAYSPRVAGVTRKVTSADLVDGTLTLRLLLRVETAGSKLVFGSAASPLAFSATNLGPGA